MATRSQIVANAEGSLRLEGLQASPEAQELAAAWARGEASEGDLAAAEQRLLTDAAATYSGAPLA